MRIERGLQSALVYEKELAVYGISLPDAITKTGAARIAKEVQRLRTVWRSASRR